MYSMSFHSHLITVADCCGWSDVPTIYFFRPTPDCILIVLLSSPMEAIHTLLGDFDIAYWVDFIGINIGTMAHFISSVQ